MSGPSVLVSGSCGLIGSEVSLFFARQGFRVVGIDNNHRAVFFGPEGDTSWVLERLRRQITDMKPLTSGTVRHCCI
jgi:CDP-paratose 2-epimerase